MNTNRVMAFGAIESPAAEKKTAWTLASVGGSLTPTPSGVFLPFVEQMKVSMQSQIGCCVGCSFEEIVRLIVFMQTGQWLDLSWRFVYAMCKALEGTTGYEIYPRTAGANDGTYPALAAIVVRKYGVPLAQYCPNNTNLSADEFCYFRKLANIPALAITDAAKRKAGADVTEEVTAAGIKRAISYAKANKGAVAILRRIGDVYWSRADGVSSWAKDDLLPMPKPRSTESGHEEMLYGYLDITKADRSALVAHQTTVEALKIKYPEDGTTDKTRTETLIFWLNHWSDSWCSSSGNEYGTNPTDHDGGRGWEFLDTWLPYIAELRISVAALPVPPDNFKYNFTKQMTDGDKGADVVALQHVLDIEGVYDYNGVPRYTGNYLSVTHGAVKRLQEKYSAEILKPVGLSVGTGVVGASTLKWLQKNYSVKK